MTYDEITLFRRFLKDKGTMNNFEYFYNNFRFRKISLDTYLERISTDDVILDAFDMGQARNTIFGFQYWKKLNEKWQQKVAEFRESGKMDIPEEEVLCKHCGRVLPKSCFAYNSKGQLHKHCKECEGGEWDRRRREEEKLAREERAVLQLESEIAERETNLAKTTKVCGHCGKRKLRSEFAPSETSEDGLQSWCKKCQEEHEHDSYLADAKAGEPNITTNHNKKMDDFTFFDFDKKSSKNSIGDNQFVINNKKGNYSIVINMTDSKKIIDAGLLRLRLRKDNITGALHLVFNADNGATCRAKSERCVTINNKDMVQFLVKTLGYSITTERILVDISENLSRSAGYITFLIKKTKK